MEDWDDRERRMTEPNYVGGLMFAAGLFSFGVMVGIILMSVV